jgi:threonine aldolase
MIDLRSDTVTRPTATMREAMATAEVGDDLAGEDPTVNRLETLAAALFGKPAALYVATGTMANQLAIRALATPGTEVLCPARAHVYCYEDAGAARNAGVQMRPLADPGGRVSPESVALAVEGVAHHLPRASVLVVENTYMAESGLPFDAATIAALAAPAHAAGLAVHCDGARIWNAAIALETPPRELAAPCDTVMFCLSKGLAAPIGSVLCGPADVIARARADRHCVGGGWRQAGIVAAAGIVALESMVERLADDHRRAASLATRLAELWPGSVDPARVRTNIVCADLARLPSDFVGRLEAAGVLAGTIDPRTVRFVTHCDVDDLGIERAGVALAEIAREG